VKTILSLCDYSGNWAKPYADAGYNVRLIDVKTTGDLRLLPFDQLGHVHGILLYGGKSERTKTMRSMTPAGFAQAFYDANP
jgi:hypothetical protein